jgi:hypothetical protein
MQAWLLSFSKYHHQLSCSICSTFDKIGSKVEPLSAFPALSRLCASGAFSKEQAMATRHRRRGGSIDDERTEAEQETTTEPDADPFNDPRRIQQMVAGNVDTSEEVARYERKESFYRDEPDDLLDTLDPVPRYEE